MIPTPDYLKRYALQHIQGGKRLSFKLICSCGCKTFHVLEKNYTDDEKRLIEEYGNSISHAGGHSIYSGIDSEGEPYYYTRILGIFKKSITLPKAPVFMGIDVIKAMCSQCQKEIVLFDSRYYGYDGMTSADEDAKKYTPHFKQRDRKLYCIEITIENEPSLAAFSEVLGEPCSFEFYSNSFSCIWVHGLDENGKKQLLYDFETA